MCGNMDPVLLLWLLLLPGENFYNFVKMFPSDAGGGEGGCTLVGEQVRGTHRCDALDMGTCAALGSLAQQLDFVDTVCN